MSNGILEHDVFGTIRYELDELAWVGSLALPVFAQFGNLGPDDHRLPEPDAEFQQGRFAFRIRDFDREGPTAQQQNAFRYLQQHEQEVCRAVMSELIEACDMKGGPIKWLQDRRESRIWGWLARIVGPEYKSPEDLRDAVRCTELELSRQSAGDYVHIAFSFETIFGTETEHGLSVIFHPDHGTRWGDSSAIDDV